MYEPLEVARCEKCIKIMEEPSIVHYRWWRVTTDEKDYSDYIKHMSSLNSEFTFLAGFTFTILTLLITLLPDPSSITAQLTLLFLAVLFDLLIFLVAWNTINNVYFCRNVPPLTKRLAIFNWLSLLCFNLSGVAIILVFLLSDLIYLALASGIIWAFSIIANIFFTWKPLMNFAKTRAYILGVAEKEERPRD